jgi:hypothetical protein
MSEEKPIRNADLARHWRCSPAYITKLKHAASAGGKGMPDFTSLEEADTWRSVHAPPKPGNHPSLNGDHGGGKNSDIGSTTTGKDKPRGLSDKIIDIAQFIRSGKNFESMMIEDAEHVPQIAFGLFELASKEGNSSEISAASKNWHECSKAAAAVRNEFLDLQERTGALISLDETMDVIGMELQAVRGGLLKLGERLANQANPQDPALARRVIDLGVDGIFRQIEAVVERAGVAAGSPVNIPSVGAIRAGVAS